MVESVPPNPNSLVPPSTPADSPSPSSLQLSPPLPNELPPPTPRAGGGFFSSIPRRPAIRVTTEYDSDNSVFFHKISCKFFESFAKLKLSFLNNKQGEVSEPQLAFKSKYLSVNYDLEGKNALLRGSADVAPGLQLNAVHDVQAEQGEVALVADLAGPAYKLELSSAVPFIGLPKATVKFPLGEFSFEEKEQEEEEVKRMLSINGILKGQVLNGVCTAQLREDNLDLRYSYKDDQMAFIPRISLPSNLLSFAFKRRFGPSDKLSYWYNFDSSNWSAVYKHTVGKDYKYKAGYDSEVRLGWASLWIGDEDGKAKTAPMKMKVQFMLQMPQDDIRSSALMFRVKKRWDI